MPRSFFQRVFGLAATIRDSRRVVKTQQTKHCSCGRRLWARGEIRTGTCATCMAKHFDAMREPPKHL